MSRRRSRNFCFTSFKIIDLEPVYEEYRDIIRYLCYGEEICPKTNKKHLQGWIQFRNPKDLRPAQKILKMGKIHMEMCNGSEYSNDKYCTKDGKYKKFGKFKSQGFRTDLEIIKKNIESGASLTEIIQDNFSMYCRYRNGIEKYVEIVTKEKTKVFRHVEVEYIHGSTGTGKTRYAMNNSTYKITGDQLQWWDGYDGEKAICIDEYDNNVPITKLLNILDGYHLRLSIKGGFTYANWTNVFITSNLEPDALHANAKTKHREALFRRITKITKMEQSTTGNTDTVVISKEI